MASKYDGHTPEPWSVQRYTNYEGWSVWAAGRGCVAERWYACSVAETNYGRELGANSRLIADAPRLLRQRDALRDAARALTHSVPPGLSKFSDWEDAFAEAWDALCDAVADCEDDDE